MPAGHGLARPIYFAPCPRAEGVRPVQDAVTARYAELLADGLTFDPSRATRVKVRAPSADRGPAADRFAPTVSKAPCAGLTPYPSRPLLSWLTLP